MTIGRSKAGETGFTLLEMLVALSVFSLAALALIRLQAYSVRNTAELELRVVAQSVVRNRAVEILTDPNSPTLGETATTAANGGLQWQISENAALVEEGRFVQVDIAARESEGRSSAALTVLRPAGLTLQQEVVPGPDFGGN